MARHRTAGTSVNDFDDWNVEIIDDLDTFAYEQLQLFSRDWTFETIASQIDQKNIDLDPLYQRRSVWNDERRSKLIESLIVGIPIPQIFLAEDPKRKRSFFVIDGKQRLLTIGGFTDPNFESWDDPQLCKLKIRKDLNGQTYETLRSNPRFEREFRLLQNADIRCAVISNYAKDDILYHIFNRLNTTSVPLSTQELRQVLHRGPFAHFLSTFTNKKLRLHDVMGLEGPDNRLRDTEIVLRFIAFSFFGGAYKGNLKDFLDKTMDRVNRSWTEYEPRIERATTAFNRSVDVLISTLGADRVGRKVTAGEFEGRFNRVLFEVEAYYFTKLPARTVTSDAKLRFIRGFETLCDTNVDFRDSIESTTKTRERYETRYREFRKLVNRVFRTKIADSPFG